MNRAPRELIEDFRNALIAEREARKALREASHRSVQVMVELHAAGVSQGVASAAIAVRAVHPHRGDARLP